MAGTRAEQPLPLHRYLLTGDLTEIRAGQLAFTGPETRLLLERHDVAAYREALMPLVTRMEGWVTGLRLVAIALRGDPAAGTAGPGDVDQLIAGYLTSEAYDSQPRATRDVLLRTSVPEQVTPDLARVLADRGAGRGMASLPELVRANVFLQPAGGGWYRYHPLFRAVLQARLKEEDPGLLARLLRRTAEWHRQRGQLADAVRYTASAGDGRLAARIVVDELAVSRLLDPDRGQALIQGLADLPAPAGRVQCRDCVTAAALAAARHDRRSAASWLGRADDILRRLPTDAEITSRLAAALVRFGLARCDGDLPGLAAAAAEQGRVLTRLPADVLSSHQELALRPRSSEGEAALWAGRFDDAEQALAQALDLPCPQSAAAVRAGCLGRLALAQALCGRLMRAGELAGKAAQADPGTACCDADTGAPVSVPAGIALALVHLERHELAQVRAELRRVDLGLRACEDRAAGAVASLAAAWLHLAEGRVADAVAMLGCARDGWSPAARRQLGHVPALTPAEPARAPDRAVLDPLLVEARIGYATGDAVAGRASLARALRIARAEDVRLPFELEHTWLFPVLRADAALARGYRALSQPGPAPPGGALGSISAAMAGPAVAGPAMVEPLTEREQEVLRRVAQLLSTAEIAEELYISVNTVKTHLKSVHRKLAVTHRRKAVRRARQLRLL
ncbi:LuxR C-terminal-related transcriptional regulator [Trebonia sp.]|uniref:LuxR C-terminal-related transcriptional regulator n=1 Tax=Trebonia sp. TaxID=2767075 RepID=UPI00262F9876|nr:LuxR C-terminal-related transcriptional regulator [Trebonia sp.]